MFNRQLNKINRRSKVDLFEKIYSRDEMEFNRGFSANGDLVSKSHSPLELFLFH